jgi:hypothetical protein
MTTPKPNPVPVMDEGTDVLIIVEDGEEWCLLDQPNLNPPPSDWNDFDPATCQPVNLREIIARLQELP